LPEKTDGRKKVYVGFGGRWTGRYKIYPEAARPTGIEQINQKSLLCGGDRVLRRAVTHRRGSKPVVNAWKGSGRIAGEGDRVREWGFSFSEFDDEGNETEKKRLRAAGIRVE